MAEGEKTRGYIPIEEFSIPIEEASDSTQGMAIWELKSEIKEIRKDTRNIIIGVAFAFVLVVGAILVEIWIFHASNVPCH